jgi:hypothetical protein
VFDEQARRPAPNLDQGSCIPGGLPARIDAREKAVRQGPVICRLWPGVHQPEAVRGVHAGFLRARCVLLGVPDIDHDNESQIQNARNYYFSRPTLNHCCRVLGLEPLGGGRDDSGIHQYAVFKLASGTNEPPNRRALSSEYKRIINKHRHYHLRAQIASALGALGLRQVVRKVLPRSVQEGWSRCSVAFEGQCE